jgi:hypothetical protein
MSQERNFGVTEAGLGLTVITCLLIALGYWIVQRLGGSGEAPPVEVRSSQTAEQTDSSPRATPNESAQPRVLVAEEPKSSDSRLPYTAHRPEWLSPQDEPLELPTQDINGLLSPLSPDESESASRPAESDPDAERAWHEPIQVR